MTAPVLEEALAVLLGGIPGSTGAFAQFAPQNARAPYFIYQRVTADRWRSLDGPSGMAQPRIQIDAYAEGYLQAKKLADAARKLLDGYRGTVAGMRIGGVSLLNDVDLFDDTTKPKLHRVSQDYLFTHDEA